MCSVNKCRKCHIVLLLLLFFAFVLVNRIQKCLHHDYVHNMYIICMYSYTCVPACMYVFCMCSAFIELCASVLLSRFLILSVEWTYVLLFLFVCFVFTSLYLALYCA